MVNGTSGQGASRAFPILRWLPDYDLPEARGDLVAGLTVGIVLIPQAMAYAVLAGVPPIYGLYASLVPLLVYPFLGTCPHLAVGVNAVSMVVVAAGVAPLAEPGTGAYVTLVIVLTALVGVLELAMGLLRLGFLADLLSRPVITGFTAAAAILIVTSQLGNLLGVEVASSGQFYEMAWSALDRLEHARLPAVAIGGTGILLLVALRRWKPAFPGDLLLLVGATAVSAAAGLGAQGVEVVGDIPSGLPGPALPALGPGEVRELWLTVLSLGLVQFMIVVSLGRVFAARHGYTVDANRELIAIGAGNLLGSLFRAIPASGSFSRTAVNEQAGARTALANWAAAALIAVILLFLTPLFRHLPLPALAAIIVVAGASLIDPREIRFLFQAKRSDGWVAALTFVCTLVLGIQEGILIGVAAAILVVLAWISRPNVAELGAIPGTREYRSRDAFGDSAGIEGVLILRVDAGLSFFNAQFLEDCLVRAARERDRRVRAVILHGMSINFLDTTAVSALEKIVDDLGERGIEVYFTGLTKPVREVMDRSGLGDWVGEQRFFMSPHAAVEYLLERWDRDEGSERLGRYREFTENEEEEEKEERAEDTRFT